ncbi:CRISPR-associated endonuclease Cas2 [Candidatus Roizmanbacteria bacterium]|nr:CRISPR-associated endonuclease Cas2 [Candidatus Roizmanbacteria bacterium]
MANKNKMFKYGELTELVLKSIADSLIEFRSYPGPSLPRLIGLTMKYVLEKRKESVKKEQLRRIINNLEKKEIIYMEEKGDEVYVRVSENGKSKLLQYSLKKIFEFKNDKKKWNGKWYIVFFDVPEIQRNKRDYLRKFLKKLGFYRYQKSVYLFPYECEKEVSLIKKIVEGAKYMKYIIAEKIEDEEEIKKHFNIN